MSHTAGMSRSSTLYRFRLSISDVDRSFYGDVDFRVAMHPSENEAYLLTRVIAYALNYAGGIQFSPGLCTGDEPALWVPGDHASIEIWIDIGNPSARRLHKAAKAAKQVRVYTYKDPESLKRETAGEQIHRAEEIEVFSLSEKYLASLAPALKKDNQWSLVHDQGELILTIGDEVFMGTIERHQLDR